MTVRSELDAAWGFWAQADLYKKWRRSNPGEAAKLDVFRAGGARPTLVTATGRALVAETAAWLLSAPAEPPPPPPPPVGEVVFDGRWETNTIPTSYNPSLPGWNVVPSWQQGTDTAGRYASITLAAGGTQSSEAVKERYPRLGTTDFYGFRWFFPAGWRSPSLWGAMIAQLGYPALKYHGWGLVAMGNRVRLALNTGRIDWNGQTPSAAAAASFEYSLQDGPAIPQARFTVGEWHYLIAEILWATTPVGVTRVWHRRASDASWTKTIDLAGIPTQQWGVGWDHPTNPLREMTVDGKYAANGTDYLCWDKFGFYAGESPYSRTLVNGGFVRASSFAAAEAALV